MSRSNNRLYFLIGGVLLLLPAFLLTWHTNSWSRQYLLARMGQTGETPNLVDAGNHPRARVWLAQDALAQGQPTDALALLAEDDIPNNKLASLVLGEVYFTQQDATQAAQVWAEVGASSWLLQAGETALAEREWEAATIYIETALQLEPEISVLPLVALYEKQEMWDKAEQVLRQAVNEFPQSPLQDNWLRTLGSVLIANGQADAGIQVYQQILAHTPQDIDALIGLGQAWQANQNTTEAKATFEQAIALDPQKGEGYMALAILLTEEGQYEAASPFFTKAVQYKPKEYAWWLQWATAAQESGCLGCAITVYEEMMQRFPQNGAAYFYVSELYQQGGQPKQAIAAIEQALRLFKPPRAQHYVRAGDIYRWANELDKAKQAYQHALQDDPLNQKALDALEQLRP